MLYIRNIYKKIIETHIHCNIDQPRVEKPLYMYMRIWFDPLCVWSQPIGIGLMISRAIKIMLLTARGSSDRLGSCDQLSDPWLIRVIDGGFTCSPCFIPSRFDGHFTTRGNSKAEVMAPGCIGGRLIVMCPGFDDAWARRLTSKT